MNFFLSLYHKDFNMEQNIIRKDMWNIAAKAGLALGLTSTAYMFATQLISGASGFMISIFSFILWAAKFSGCIMLMKFFMGKFAESHPEVTNRDTFNFGKAAAILSALVYAAASFANVAFISGDAMVEQMHLVMQQMGSMMDSNTMAMMEKYIDYLPEYTFFSTLLYSFIFGVVLSFILSRNIPSRDPFADYKPDQQ